MNALFIVKVHLAIKLVHRHPTFNNLKETIIKLKRNMTKNPNWQEATSWPVTKRGKIESGTTGNKCKTEVRVGFEPRATACKPNALTTEPCSLPMIEGREKHNYRLIVQKRCNWTFLLFNEILLMWFFFFPKLLAVFQEGSTIHRPTQNGGYRSASSAGTASPDLSPPEDESPKYIEEPHTHKSYLPIDSKVENTNGEIISNSSRSRKSPPPTVAPKPLRTVRHISVSSRTSYNESVPSEDSGISMRDDRDRYRIGSDSSKSEINENVSVKHAIYRRKSGETTFAAIGMPIKRALYNGLSNGDRTRLSSTSSDHADTENSEVEEETFSLGRNSTRKSMFSDSPMMDRWAELQEQKMFEVSEYKLPIESYVKFEITKSKCITRKNIHRLVLSAMKL